MAAFSIQGVALPVEVPAIEIGLECVHNTYMAGRDPNETR
jgi:hypothetical protein